MIVQKQDAARREIAAESHAITKTSAGDNVTVEGLTELRAYQLLADLLHRSRATHGTEFLKHCEHQKWRVELARGDGDIREPLQIDPEDGVEMERQRHPAYSYNKQRICASISRQFLDARKIHAN